jgi:hypothetical protein
MNGGHFEDSVLCLGGIANVTKRKGDNVAGKHPKITREYASVLERLEEPLTDEVF